jgi:hypothetical protein
MANTNRNYSRKQAKSLADIDTKKLIKDLDKPFSVLVGLAAGVPVAMIVEKAVGNKSTVSGLLGIDGTKLTRVLKPAVNIALGMSINQLAKNPNIKLAGVGLAANGGLIAVKDFLGKDILKGTGSSDIGEIAAPLAQPPVQVIERAIEATPLNLPVLEIDEPENEAYRYIEDVASDVQGTRHSGMGRGMEEPVDTDEEEIILSSDRPEDNYETQPEDSVSGELELVIEDEPKAQVPASRPMVIDKDVEEDMDFTDIP